MSEAQGSNAENVSAVENGHLNDGKSAAHNAALLFKRWAQENDLMDSQFPVPVALTESQKDEAFDQFGISANSESIFRGKGISSVLFDDSANRVVVLTNRKLTQQQYKSLPKQFGDSVSVEYIFGGVGQVGAPASPLPNSRYYIHSGRYACGSSIHPAKYIGAGTLGCLVKDSTGKLLGLSNNHVSGLCSFAQRGEKILAPGHLDISAGGCNPFTIGYHLQTLEFSAGVPDNVDVTNNSDAAIFEVADAELVSSMQGNYHDTPGTVAELSPGQIVTKVGRTTGMTQGVVLGQTVSPDCVNYHVAPLNGATVVYFPTIFAIRSLSASTPFSEAGDSGSLITTEINGQRIAVGLIFAGTSSGLSYALSLPPLLTKLGVSIVSGHNV